VPVNTPGRTANAVLAADKSAKTGANQTNTEQNTAAPIIKLMTEAPVIPFGSAYNPRTLAVLDMKGYDQEFIRNFTFKNTSAVTYTINSVDFMKQDNQFEFYSIEPMGTLPMDVAPGETFSIHVAFHAFDRNKLCSNQLLFHTEQGKNPIVYPIQAMQQPLSAMPWNKPAYVATHAKVMNLPE
jgi:hypothetical protein